MLEISMILADNNRSKAYLQSLIRNNIMPKYVAFMKNDRYLLPEQARYSDIIYKDYSQKIMRKVDGIKLEFDEKESIEETLIRNNIPYSIHGTLDINDKQIINIIKNFTSQYVVFSGPGGSILKEDILSTGKLFIHVHPGNLPKYKGSTTFYYSMLTEKSISCSVIILNEKIDSGKILYKKHFDIPKVFTDYDTVFDPIIRASTLVDFLKGINNEDEVVKLYEANGDGDQFYIIHPLLKHIAIMAVRGENLDEL